MKKYMRIFLLITILMFPIIVNAKDSIFITKIEEVGKQGHTEVLNNPVIDGLTINYFLSFANTGDSITFKATVQNDDTEDYRITNKTEFSKSGYIQYSFTFSDDTATIKPKETKDMYITIAYYKEVPDDKLTNGIYQEENQMDIILVNDTGEIPNPNTSSSVFIIFIILTIALISIALYNYNKKVSLFILIVAILIPITTYALKEIKLSLNTYIVIGRESEFCNFEKVGENDRVKRYFKYRTGMTWNEWKVSSYFDEEASIGGFATNAEIECEDDVFSRYDLDNITSEEYDNYLSELNQCYSNTTPLDDINIIDKSEGCYMWYVS